MCVCVCVCILACICGVYSLKKSRSRAHPGHHTRAPCDKLNSSQRLNTTTCDSAPHTLTRGIHSLYCTLDWDLTASLRRTADRVHTHTHTHIHSAQQGPGRPGLEPGFVFWLRCGHPSALPGDSKFTFSSFLLLRLSGCFSNMGRCVGWSVHKMAPPWRFQFGAEVRKSWKACCTLWTEFLFHWG